MEVLSSLRSWPQLPGELLEGSQYLHGWKCVSSSSLKRIFHATCQDPVSAWRFCESSWSWPRTSWRAPRRFTISPSLDVASTTSSKRIFNATSRGPACQTFCKHDNHGCAQDLLAWRFFESSWSCSELPRAPRSFRESPLSEYRASALDVLGVLLNSTLVLELC